MNTPAESAPALTPVEPAQAQEFKPFVSAQLEAFVQAFEVARLSKSSQEFECEFLKASIPKLESLMPLRLYVKVTIGPMVYFNELTTAPVDYAPYAAMYCLQNLPLMFDLEKKKYYAKQTLRSNKSQLPSGVALHMGYKFITKGMFYVGICFEDDKTHYLEMVQNRTQIPLDDIKKQEAAEKQAQTSPA